MAFPFLNRHAAESECASGGMKHGESTMDIDNIPKPISDALQGLVYLDDEQVTDVLCRKRNLNS
jgi:Holliday junction resolvase RusA-like endonuclease